MATTQSLLTSMLPGGDPVPDDGYRYDGNTALNIDGGTYNVSGGYPAPTPTAVVSSTQPYPGIGGAGYTPVETPEQTQLRMAREAAAADAARKAAQAAALRSGITGIINNIKGVYDSIYGDIDTAGKDQARALTERNKSETDTLTNQFGAEFPKIGNAFAARGAYDSSYRIDRENDATTGYQDQVRNLGLGFQDDLSKVGQYVAGERAKVQSGRGGVDAVLARINESEDPNELTSLRNELDSRLRSLQESRAGYNTQQGYLDQLNQVAPASDRMASITSSLTNVINSSVPTALKRSIGTQLINNAALPPAEAQQLLTQLSAQLATDEQKQLA